MVNLVKIEKGKVTVFNDRVLAAQFLTEDSLDAEHIEELRTTDHSTIEKDSHHEAIVHQYTSQYGNCGFYPVC